MKFKEILSAPFGLSLPFILAFRAFISCHFLSFWPFGLSFPFILAFWAFISFHFGLILAFWAFISFHFGLLGFHFLSFWPFGPSFPLLNLQQETLHWKDVTL